MQVAVSSSLPDGWTNIAFDRLFVHVLGGDWGKAPGTAPKSWVDVSVIRGTEFRDWDSQRGSSAAHRVIKLSSFERRELRNGDLVIEISGGGPEQPVGRPLRIDEAALKQSARPLICSNFCRQVRLSDELDSSFVHYCLKHLYHQGEFNRFQNQTVNIRNLQFPEFAAETTIPIPPFAEQKRIVAKVEDLLGRLGKAGERLERVPSILKNYRQSVLAAACTGRLTANWREENAMGDVLDELLDVVEDERRSEWAKQLGNRRYRAPTVELHGELFDIPETWRWVTFDRCSLDITVGHVGSMRDKYVTDGVPFLRSQNVRPLRFDSTGIVHIPRSFDEQLSKSRLYGGEILVTRSGANTGDSCVYPPDAPPANCSDVVISRPLSILNSNFGVIFICSPEGEAYLRRGETGIAQPHFNTKAMRNTPLPLPPPEEQEEIVLRTNSLLAVTDRIESLIKAAAHRTEKVRHSILTKAFSGELVDTEADLARREGREYEPASVLLERIARRQSHRNGYRRKNRQGGARRVDSSPVTRHKTPRRKRRG